MRISILLFVGSLLVLMACKKESTSWNTNWEFPLLRDTVRIADWINDSTISVGSNGALRLTLNRELIDFDLFSLVSLPDTIIEQDFTISVSQITIPPGTNYIDEIKEHEFGFGGAALTSTYIKRGVAEVTVINPIATKTIFTVQLPGVTKDGQTFTRTEEVPAAVGGVPTQKSFTIDLSEHAVDLTGASGNFYNTIQSRMTVATDPNGPSVNVTSQDAAIFRVEFKDLLPSHAKGYFGSTTISDTANVDVEALSKIDAELFQMESASVKLIFSNGVKVKGSGIVSKVEGLNKNNELVALNHPDFNESFLVNPAQGSWENLNPFQYTLDLNNDNTNIQPFIENLPYQFNIGYAVHLNPWGNVSSGTDEIFPNSRLGLQLETDIPLNLSIDKLRYIDTIETNFAEQENAFRIQSGGLVLSSINSFPFGARVEMIALDEAKNELFLVSSQDGISPATFNLSEFMHDEVLDEVILNLTDDQISHLPNVKSFILKVIVNSSTLDGNQLYEKDELKLSLKTQFKLNTKL